MGLFSVMVKTFVETLVLPVSVAHDVVDVSYELMAGPPYHLGHYTERRLKAIKKASEDKKE